MDSKYKMKDYNNLSEEERLKEVKKYGTSICYMDNPSEAIQLEAVKQSEWTIYFIMNPSEAVQLEAVKNWGWVIQFIKNPSKEVQLAAIKRNPLILNELNRYIKDPCQEVVDMAMIKDIIE